MIRPVVVICLNFLAVIVAAQLSDRSNTPNLFVARQYTTSAQSVILGRVSSPALARTNINVHDGIGNGTDQYILYTGNGSFFPPISAWVSFSNMCDPSSFDNYTPLMLSSCAQFSQPDNSRAELASLYAAIRRVAFSTRLDQRFILAVVLQESSGCVRAPTTNYGVRNPGLMQSHNGYWSCNDAARNGGVVLSPCPPRWVANMIGEGVGGTSSGDGLVQLVESAVAALGTTDVRGFYWAARMYNSGSVYENCLECGYATHCYVSDIANRLTGWVNAPHACSLDSEHPGLLSVGY